MPAEIGAGEFWTSMVDFTTGTPAADAAGEGSGTMGLVSSRAAVTHTICSFRAPNHVGGVT